MGAIFVRLHISFLAASLGLLLAACQHQQAAQVDREAGNPFKYTKKSSVCKITPIIKETDGSWKTTMAVRSDDGECEFTVQQPDSKVNFISFGISALPDHGKAFIYNYDKRTYVRYTPVTAYAGSDKFTVNLIHQDGMKKLPLTVTVTVDNTGVQPPKATAPGSEAKMKKTTTAHKKLTRHKTVTHHRVRKAVK